MYLRNQFTDFTSIGSGPNYPDPFLDIASLSIPNNFRSVLYWCEYIYSVFGTYRMAMERIISYFLTDIEILNTGDDERQKWLKFLYGPLNILSEVQALMRDRMCYGNAFASLMVPFARWLTCKKPGCGFSVPLKQVAQQPALHFEFSLPEFIFTCPVCKHRGPAQVVDRPDDLESKIRIKRWSPHEIELLADPYTHQIAYLWRIPEDYKRQLRQGHLFYLERVPLPVLEAVAKNQMFRFHDDMIFHLKEPTLSGIVNRGWGIPRILTNFRQIWYIQVLRRFNEAIALDYVIPFRVITPAPATGSTGKGGMPTDPLLFYNGVDFRAQVQNMIRRRRRDPASLNVLPFPVQYQIFGADANHLAPRELLDQALETLLNDAGTPVELYNGTLQLQVAPVALRLFESVWCHLIHDTNRFLQWLVQQVAQVLSWEPAEARLRRISIADNLEKQMMAAQLMMSQQLSATTVLRDMGFDWQQEQKQIAQESQFQARLQARTQEEMEQAGFAQQIAKAQPQSAQAPPGGAPPGAPPGGMPPPPGGAPPPGAADPSLMGGAMGTSMQGPVSNYIASLPPNVPQTPQDMLAVAESLAQELLGMPESAKDSELRKLKQYNEVLHALVRSRMEQIRRNTRSQAGNQAMAAMQGGGGAPPM